MIKFVVFDFDGVFSDGQIYFNSEKNVFKSFNSKDSYGLQLLKDNHIKTAIITNDSEIMIDNTKYIFDRLDRCSIGQNRPKLDILNEWITDFGLTYSDVAYIGDDISDIPILKNVGFSGCPSDAVQLVQEAYCVKNYFCQKTISQLVHINIIKFIFLIIRIYTLEETM